MPRAKSIRVGLDVLFLKEGDYVVAYAPALEVSSYGKTEQSARKAFAEALALFFEETERKGTLERVLLRHGWTLTKHRYDPPRWSAGELFRLCNSRPMIDAVTEDVRIPLGVAT